MFLLSATKRPWTWLLHFSAPWWMIWLEILLTLNFLPRPVCRWGVSLNGGTSGLYLGCHSEERSVFSLPRAPPRGGIPISFESCAFARSRCCLIFCKTVLMNSNFFSFNRGDIRTQHVDHGIAKLHFDVNILKHNVIGQVFCGGRIGAALSGKNHGWDTRCFWFVLKHGEKLDAVHSRHGKVCKNDFRLETLQLGKGLFSVAGRLYIEYTLFQVAANRVPDEHGVIYH